MSTRRSAREFAFRILFESDVGGTPLEEVLSTALERTKLDDAGQQFASDLCRAVAGGITRFDVLITRTVTGHSFERLARTDLTVLRMALAEMREMGTPVAIVINEAVDLADKFGTEQSGGFVNGVLGKIVKDWEIPSDQGDETGGGTDS